MCTATTYKTNSTYFGRNLDLDFSYHEEIVITPRNFPLPFRHLPEHKTHYAILGVAYVAPNPATTPNTDYPLYYDAINEKGLGIASLNFVGNAVYRELTEQKDNLAQFELIPWLLGQCATVAEARKLLTRINLTNTPFSPELPLSELHWLISDSTESIVIEAVRDGLKVYNNPTNTLTNNPPFPEQLFHLNNFQSLSTRDPINTFAPNLPLAIYSRGMGAIGLPGDLSSESRFVKAVFTKTHSLSSDDELASVSQFFHILHSVDQQRGCNDLGDQKYEITIYSSCYNLDQGICYYTTYDNHQISAVRLESADLNSTSLARFPMLLTEQINYQN